MKLGTAAFQIYFQKHLEIISYVIALRIKTSLLPEPQIVATIEIWLNAKYDPNFMQARAQEALLA